MKSKFLLLLIVSVIAAYFLYLRRGVEISWEGKQAPNFQLPTKTASVSLDQYKGKVVLLNFWATWCPSCVREIPSLEALNHQLQGQDFQLLAISLDEEGWPAIDRFLQRQPQQLSMMILLDARGDIASLYGTYQLPETYLINKEGVIVKKYVGPEEWTSPEVMHDILSEVQKVPAS